MDLYVGTFKAMFTVEYSDTGSALRCSEEQTYIYFTDLLDECEGMSIRNSCGVTDINVLQTMILKNVLWKTSAFFFWSQVHPSCWLV